VYFFLELISLLYVQ